MTSLLSLVLAVGLAPVASPPSSVPATHSVSASPSSSVARPESQALAPREVAGYLARHPGALILDVRRPDEFSVSHIPDARLVPLDTLAAWAVGQPKDRPLVLVCRAGRRSASAAGQLAEAGFLELAQVRGGLQAWEEAGLATCSGTVALPDAESTGSAPGEMVPPGRPSASLGR